MNSTLPIGRLLKWTLCCLFLGISLCAFGQRRYSLFVGGGTSYYYGDLTDGFNPRLLSPAGTIGLSTYIFPSVSLRFAVSYARIGAADSLANDPNRRKRNLHFWSPITELSGVVVYELFPDRHFGRWRGKGKVVISPYLFGGASIFRFDPRAQVENGLWLALQPLGTEGQNIRENNFATFPYQLTQISLPVGAGVEMRFSSNLGARVELGYRTTFTDYLDDVSTFYPEASLLEEASGPEALALSYRGTGAYPEGAPRGSPTASDSYAFLFLSLVYYMPND